jgi:hypothetical protein
MADKAEVQKWMDIIVQRLNDVGPYVAADWGGAVQFIFPDLGTGWFLKMAMDGTVESCEEKIDEASANGVVEIDSDIFVGIYNKTVSQAEARASGKIKARGSLDAMLKVWVPTIE